MSYTIKETRTVARPAAELLAIAGEVVFQLGGKRPKRPDTAGEIRADFNKAVGGAAFGNRVQLIVHAADDGSGGCTTSVEAYPIDPLGKPLQFGVIGEPARLVTTAFWAQLDRRVKPAPA